MSGAERGGGRNGWTDWLQKGYFQIEGGGGDGGGWLWGNRERELMHVEGHNGALRNEHLFVGLVGVRRAATCLLHPNHI